MWSEQKLDLILTEPSERLIEDLKKIKGNIMVLGAGGKMGPSLCVLIKRAAKAAGINKEVIAVSRFSDQYAVELLKEYDVKMIPADLLNAKHIEALPDADNIIFMAGKKFGTNGQEAYTWAMNSIVPANVAKRFTSSNTVVFSSGNIYPLMAVVKGGADEKTMPSPVGEYAMSCMARERVFEYYSLEKKMPVLLYRLNYAVELRYGVLHDIGLSIINSKPIPLESGVVNYIWQKDANEIAVRSLLYTSTPPAIMNITGPETLSVREIALEMGEYLGKSPIFEGQESEKAFINNSSKSVEIFGYPSVAAKTLIKWQAEWLLQNGRSLGKPTHFEERKGAF